jgi:hypothetical protein
MNAAIATTTAINHGLPLGLHGVTEDTRAAVSAADTLPPVSGAASPGGNGKTSFAPPIGTGADTLAYSTMVSIDTLVWV